MANNENLIPMNERTKKEQREIARQGGIASGEARREKATMKKTLEMLLNEHNDKGITYRCSTGNSERIGDTVEYPYIQPYQSGINPTSELFIIKNCNLYKLNRVIANDPMSSYIKTEIKEDVSEQFYNDEVFDAIGKPPVNVGSQTLLEIIENE